MNYIKLLDWEPYKVHYKNHKEIIDKSNDERKKIILELRNQGSIALAEKFEDIEIKKASSLKNFFSKRKALKKEYSYLGYISFRVFLYEFGRSVFSLIPSLILLLLLFNSELISRFKLILITGTLGFIYVSFFWLFHSVFIKTDYNISTYNLSYILAALVTTVIIFTALKLLTAIEQKKKQTQKELEEIVLNGKELVELLTPKMP